MRVFICLCACAVILSGCGTAMRSSGASKVRQSVEFINYAKKNIKTVSCDQLDSAMSQTYLHYKTFSDKRVIRAGAVGKPDRAKGWSLILKAQLADFKQEYARRCKEKPLRTKAIEKLYPEMSRAALELYKRKKRKEQKH